MYAVAPTSSSFVAPLSTTLAMMALFAIPELEHVVSLVVGLLGGIVLQTAFGITERVAATVFARNRAAADERTEYLNDVEQRTNRALGVVNRGVFTDDETVREDVTEKIEALINTRLPPKVDREEVACVRTRLDVIGRALESAEDAPTEAQARIELATHLERLKSEVEQLLDG